MTSDLDTTSVTSYVVTFDVTDGRTSTSQQITVNINGKNNMYMTLPKVSEFYNGRNIFMSLFRSN